MSEYTFYDQTTSELRNYIPDLEQAYIILVVVVPMMIVFLLFITFMMLISIVGVSDRLNEIRKILEDRYSEESDVVDEIDRVNAESEREVPIDMGTNSVDDASPSSNNHKIITKILAVSIPILLVVLAVVVVVFG